MAVKSVGRQLCWLLFVARRAACLDDGMTMCGAILVIFLQVGSWAIPARSC